MTKLQSECVDHGYAGDRGGYGITTKRYPDMFTLLTGKRADGGTSGLTVRQSPYMAEAISLSIDHSKWTRLDADAALQLAHDIRRMAMKIKREQR